MGSVSDQFHNLDFNAYFVLQHSHIYELLLSQYRKLATLYWKTT